MQWTWDEEKSRANKRKHGFRFAFAALVFEDEFALSRPDPYPDEPRWQTIGLAGTALLFVVHTVDGDDEGRIINARKATTRERKDYEDGCFS